MLQEAIVTTPPTILPNFKSLCQPPRLVRSAFPSGYELPRYPPVTCWGERFIFFQSLTCETPYSARAVQSNELTSEVDNKWWWASLDILFHRAKMDVARKWKVVKYVPRWQNDRNREGCVSLTNNFGLGNFCNALNSLLKLIFLAPRSPLQKNLFRHCCLNSKAKTIVQ